MLAGVIFAIIETELQHLAPACIQVDWLVSWFTDQFEVLTASMFAVNLGMEHPSLSKLSNSGHRRPHGCFSLKMTFSHNCG